MNRRDSLKSIGVITGHALFPSVLSSFLISCESQKEIEMFTPQFFDLNQYQSLPEVIDIIIPSSLSSRSASSSGVHLFLDSVFFRCLSKEEQIELKNAFSPFFAAFKKEKNKVEYLQNIDVMAFDGDDQYAFFKTLKRYTMIGFFTSEEGETKASTYDKIPGDYQSDIKVTEQTKNWGNTNLHYYF